MYLSLPSRNKISLILIIHKLIEERDIYETTRLNLYTDKCKYSDVIFLVLKNHICSVTSNPQLLNSIFTDPQ